MTAKKKLKRRVRDRMKKTGEQYAAALKQIRGQAAAIGAESAGPKPPGGSAVKLNATSHEGFLREMGVVGSSMPAIDSGPRDTLKTSWVEVSKRATEHGFACSLWVSRRLAEACGGHPDRPDVGGVLNQLREALAALEGDPAAVLLRGAALEGANPELRHLQTELWAAVLGSEELVTELLNYIHRLRLGIRGVSRDGRRIALDADFPGAKALAVAVLGMPLGPEKGPMLRIMMGVELLEIEPKLRLLRGRTKEPKSLKAIDDVIAQMRQTMPIWDLV